ncbi:uncharacterized protein B0H18DRAFT_1018036 [Fomitopsis serialis]|uniref:uncharacterized protein n=1 Tax=Fomitopsis serialis TaxID=139415 RepID=UPI002008C19D|nr:uncharacterized protein B0H18DRAFT_1018036 [Neoantrodia serialis]KAH9922524.1 hypothetical protein B0H18DRAFT_1018036 [Neoantrodia serialis]
MLKLALSSLVLLFSTANALQLHNLTYRYYQGETLTENWQSQSGDPASFSLLLQSTARQAPPETFALVADVSTAEGSVSFTVPDVSDGLYVLNAVNVTNDNDIYSQTASFYVS